MPPALPVVRVESNRRNAGKTWLASALIEELTGRGYAVGAVKHSHHPTAPDKAGSDTDFFARAGATRVVFAASDGVLDRTLASTNLERALDRLRGEVDIAIVEGFKSDAIGARLRIDADQGAATLTSMDGRQLLTTTRNDAPGLADAIEREFELATGGSEELRRLVRRAAAAHGHACPGVTLGVRMALAASVALGIVLPAPDRGMEVTVETARCAADALGAATGCSLGRGTMHLVEQGILAATFVDTRSHALKPTRAVRVVARDESKAFAALWAPEGVTRRHAQAIAYRVMPDELLFDVAAVTLEAARDPAARTGALVGVGRRHVRA